MASDSELVEAFRRAGQELWLVGGALRDRLLGLPGADLDYATDALPDEIERIASDLQTAVSPVGKRYGTIGVFVSGRWAEITTFRGESYTDGSRWPDVSFGTSIKEDLQRRDFTINAIAENAATHERLDLFGGEADLKARTIRAVGEPEARFREDPLRILRGIRFVSQLDFSIESRTAEAMARTAPLLASLSQERVTAELDKLLQGRRPARGLEALRTTGALHLVLPELVPMVGCEQNSFHQFDVWGHTLATVDAIATTDDNRRVRRWTALLHDAGKPSVCERKTNGEWGFYRHEKVGAELAGALLGRLRLGRKDALVICLLIARHMDRPKPEDARSVRRFMARCYPHWRDLLALKRADNVSHTYDDNAYHDALEVACERAELEEAEQLRAESPLSGDDLMTMFGRAPGPWIRVIKQQLSRMVLDGRLAPGDQRAAQDIARRLMHRQP